MKKIILLGFTLFTFLSSFAQTKEKAWNVGLHFGTQEYRGDLGDEFFSFNQHAAYGLSLSKYMNPYFDIQGMITYSNLNHFNTELNKAFEAKLIDFNLMAKFKFNNGKLLKENSLVQPFAVIGFGDGLSFADHYANNTSNLSLDVNMLAGLGVNFVVSERLGISIMSKYSYMWTDNLDNTTISGKDFQDQALMTTLGLTYNFNVKKDSDNDGVYDKEDKCPEVAGLAIFGGCPDTDLDGVEDSKDDCPTVFGTLKGCPDTDKDGIADKDDACPEIAGIAIFNGCADTDGDGIENSKDNCPTIAGTLNGCPDMDGDGVADKDDDCPKVKGTLKGCPDTDKDGVIVSKDKCPKLAGVVSNGGCPVIKEETKQVMAQAMEGLFFKSGSAIIQTKSYEVLNNVAKIMIENPSYKLTIEGYTDNTGNEIKNLQLSKDRAAAAKAYLISKGVDASKLTSDGYGVAKPRAENNTAAGRALNRRVEFTVNF